MKLWVHRNWLLIAGCVNPNSGNSEVFHTYSTFTRGIENLMGAFTWLDLTPGGRHRFDDGHSRLSEDGCGDSLSSATFSRSV